MKLICCMNEFLMTLEKTLFNKTRFFIFMAKFKGFFLVFFSVFGF